MRWTPFFCMIACAASASVMPARAEGTLWDVRASQGFDALCALNLLSGDEYYLGQYPDEAREFATPRFAKARHSAAQLKKTIHDDGGRIVSAFLTLILSGGPDSTLKAVLASARHPEPLERAFRSSPFWSQDSWDCFARARPQVVEALEAMHGAGFEQIWQRHLGHDAASQVARMHGQLSRYDVLGEQARLLGHELQSGRIEVILLWYSRPHGIRIQGGRFLTNMGYPVSVVLRNATHEPLHPPFDVGNPGVKSAIEALANDSLISRIVARHNPSFGYTTVPGYVEEDAVQALEQMVCERLGVAVPASERWKENDDGMHVLAAAMYDLMKESGFAERGGRFEDWFAQAVAERRLAPAEVVRRARAVMGDQAVDRWLLR